MTRLALCGLLLGALLLAGLGPAPAQGPAVLPREVVNSIGLKLVLIPPGRFLMGSPADEKDRYDDEPQHEVEITRAFYLGVYPVTQAEYRKVTGHNPAEFNEAALGEDTSRFPVEMVTHVEALTFLRGLAN